MLMPNNRAKWVCHKTFNPTSPACRSSASIDRLFPLSFFEVDILALKPILLLVCIGTHSTGANSQASPKEACPFLYSPFKILNFRPLQSRLIRDKSGPIKANQGGSIEKIANNWEKNGDGSFK
jgi:hypothetical protein